MHVLNSSKVKLWIKWTLETHLKITMKKKKFSDMKRHNNKPFFLFSFLPFWSEWNSNIIFLCDRVDSYWYVYSYYVLFDHFNKKLYFKILPPHRTLLWMYAMKTHTQNDQSMYFEQQKTPFEKLVCWRLAQLLVFVGNMHTQKLNTIVHSKA